MDGSFHHAPSEFEGELGSRTERESRAMKEHSSLARVGAHIRVNRILHACMWYNVVTLHGLVRVIFLVGPIGHDEETVSGGDGATSRLPYLQACCLHILRIRGGTYRKRFWDLSLVTVHYCFVSKRTLQDICIAAKFFFCKKPMQNIQWDNIR